jgi:DnaK suppressor protein
LMNHQWKPCCNVQHYLTDRVISTIDLEDFEQRLLTLQEQTLGVADLVADSAKPVALDQSSVGRLSRMDAMQGQAMAQASVHLQQIQLSRIEAALQRVEDGDYGRCLECDNWIATGRLLVDLTAEYCIACARDKEL